MTAARKTTERRRLLLLLAAVLAAHLGVAWLSRDGVIRDDAVSYVLLGENLAAGHGFVFQPGGHPTSWRAPGYPVFLAGIFRLGGSEQTARVAQAFLWVLIAWLAYLLARRLVDRRAGLVAAGLVGFYPEFLGFTGLLWSESLFIALFLGALAALLAAAERPTAGRWLAVGLLIGAAALTRSTGLVVLLPLTWVAALRGGAPALRGAALASVVALGCVGAWSFRNYQVHGTPILVESNTGFNLYAGSAPDTPIPFSWRKLETLNEDERYLALVEGRSEAERYRVLTGAALEQLRERPLRALALTAGKTFDFWLPDFFIARNVRAGAFGPAWPRAWLAILLLTVSASVVTLAAASWQAWRRRGRWATRFLILLLALYTLPHAVVYGASRYRLPATALVLVLAAPAFVRPPRGRVDG